MNIQEQKAVRLNKLSEIKRKLKEIEGAQKYIKEHFYVVLERKTNTPFIVDIESLFNLLQGNRVYKKIYKTNIRQIQGDFNKIRNHELYGEFETFDEAKEYVAAKAEETTLEDLRSIKEFSFLSPGLIGVHIESHLKTMASNLKKDIDKLKQEKIKVVRVDNQVMSLNDFEEKHLIEWEDFTTYGGYYFSLFKTKGLKEEQYFFNKIPGQINWDEMGSEIRSEHILIPIDKHPSKSVSSTNSFEENWSYIESEAQEQSDQEDDDDWDD